MKGVIFNLLEDFITDGWGEETYEAILALCPLTTADPFVGPGTYPDHDLLAIVTKFSEKLGLSADDTQRAFGKYCFPELAKKFPMFVSGYRDPKAFLKTINSVIHVEARKLFREAEPPKITFVDPGPTELVLLYESKRNLCQFMAGLLDGTAIYFRAPMEHTEKRCRRSGSSTCEFHIRFPRVAA